MTKSNDPDDEKEHFKQVHIAIEITDDDSLKLKIELYFPKRNVPHENKNQILCTVTSILLNRGVFRAKMKSLLTIIYFLKALLLTCLRESWIRLGFRFFNMVKWIYTLKHEPFSLTLSSDFAVDVDDDDLVDKTFLKRLMVSKKKMLSSLIQSLRKNCKSNKTKLVKNNSDFKVPTRCWSKSKINLKDSEN